MVLIFLLNTITKPHVKTLNDATSPSFHLSTATASTSSLLVSFFKLFRYKLKMQFYLVLPWIYLKTLGKSILSISLVLPRYHSRAGGLAFLDCFRRQRSDTV